MEYPIVLTGDKRSIFACSWNEDIHEIHTQESLKKDYGSTNLFENEATWCVFTSQVNRTFLEVLEDMEAGEYDTARNDNMTITIVKRAGL